MSKKVLLVFMLVGLTLLSFGKTKISVWQFMMDDNLSQQVKADFEKANPDIELEIVQLSWATGFDRIVTSIAAGTFKRFWDDDAKVPYLYDGETFITYEDPQSVAEKARYVKEMDLGGIMYWEYVDDIENDLLNSAYETLKK